MTPAAAPPPPPPPPPAAPAAPPPPGKPGAGPGPLDGPEGLRKLFEVWVDSDLKAQVVVFYNENPGVIETVDGLARRLGLHAEALRAAIDDHIRYGLLHERRVGDKTVLIFNRDRRAALQDAIVQALRKRREADA